MMALEFAATDSVGRLVGQLRTVVLVDSGADITHLNAELAPRLGLDLQSLPTVWVRGVGGTRVETREADVLAHLCGRWVRMPVLFQEDGRNLLGRAGAFEAINIAFIHSSTVMLGHLN